MSIISMESNNYDNDPLLAKARALTLAARKTSENFHQHSIQTEHKEKIEVQHPIIDLEYTSRQSPSKTFRASVIRGSTLINTHTDIRNIVKRGDHIYVDGNLVKIAIKGEWQSNRIEIDSDYAGDTNFDAVITFDPASINSQTPVKNKKKVVPIPSEDIQSAILQLNAVNDLCMKFKKEEADKLPKSNFDSNLEKKPKKKTLRLISSEKTELSSPSKAISLSNQIYDSQQQVPVISLTNLANVRLPPLNTSQKSTSSRNIVSNVTDRSDQTTKSVSNASNRNGSSAISEAAVDFYTDDNGDVGPIQALLNFQRNRIRSEDPAVLATRRVKQKLKDDHKRRLEEEKEKEAVRLAAQEANELKVHELKEKTMARVARYKEQLLRRQQEEKELLQQEQERKKEKEKEMLTEEKRLKMLSVRREAKERLQYHQKADEMREQQREEFIQQQLGAIAKKFELPTAAFINPNPNPNPSDRGTGTGTGISGSKGRPQEVEVAYSIVDDEPVDAASANNNKQSKTSKQRKSNPENSLPALVDRGAKDGRMKNADGKRKGGEKAADLSVQDTVLRSRSEQARRTHSDLSSDSHGNHNEGSNRKNAALSANAEYSSEARVNGIQQQPYNASRLKSDHKPKSGKDSDSDSWNDDLLEDSIEFRPQPRAHKTLSSGEKLPAVRTDPHGLSMPGLGRPPLYSTAQPSQKNANLKNTEDNDNLSDMTPENSPSVLKRSKQKGDQKSKRQTAAEDALTFQPSIITKSSSTSSAKVWRKLKPIPVAPYVPVA